MLERLKWPGAAAVLAVLGAAIRRWQLGSAFDGEGLAVPGAPASWAMIAFYILAGAVLLCLARSTPAAKKPEKRLTAWDTAFAAENDSVYLTLMVAAALLALAAAPLLFREAAQLMAVYKYTGEGDNGLLQVILAVCAVPACIGLLYAAQSGYRMRGRGRENAALLLPVLMCCLWMLESYRANAAHPERWGYVPLLLAAALGLLFYLDCAGLAFDKGHPRRMLWLAGMTAVTGGAALAGLPGYAAAALLASQTLAALAALWLVPGNLRNPPGADRFGKQDENERDGGEQDAPAAQEIQEEDSHV